jgi:hypothetical protein
MSWNDLLNDETVEPSKDKTTVIQPPTAKVEPSTEKVEPSITPPPPSRIPEKKSKKSNKVGINSVTELWEYLIAHRSEFGVAQLIGLLSSKPVGSVPKLSAEIVGFKRTPAVNAILEILKNCGGSE